MGKKDEARLRRERFKLDGCGGKVMDAIGRSKPPGLTIEELVGRTKLERKQVRRALDSLLCCQAIVPCGDDRYFTRDGGGPGERRIMRDLFDKKNRKMWLLLAKAFGASPEQLKKMKRAAQAAKIA